MHLRKQVRFIEEEHQFGFLCVSHFWKVAEQVVEQPHNEGETSAGRCESGHGGG